MKFLRAVRTLGVAAGCLGWSLAQAQDQPTVKDPAAIIEGGPDVIDGAADLLGDGSEILDAGAAMAGDEAGELLEEGSRLLGDTDTDELVGEIAEAASAIQIDSLNTEYDQTLGIARATGNVQIRYGGAIINAEEAEYHIETGDVYAKNNVRILKDGQIFRGDEAVYNVNTGVIVANRLRGGMGPIFYDSGAITLPSGDIDVIRTQNTWVTTHDHEAPNYYIKAKKINIYPDKYIVFRSATVKAGKIPVIWLPMIAQPLNDELGYYFTPGFSDAWGAYLLNQYGFLIGDHTVAQAHLDYRAERGLAAGLDLESVRWENKEEIGRIQFYYAQDDAPNQGTSGEPRLTDFDEERYRINVQHRVYLPGPEESTLYLDVDINKLSDEFFYLDFFPGEFRDDPRPDNLVNLVKRYPRGTISLLGRFQLNDFFRTDTRLPEIALDMPRQTFLNTDLFYEGNTSYGIYADKLADPRITDLQNRVGIAENTISFLDDGLLDPDQFDRAEQESLLTQLRAELDEDSFNRFYTYHQLSYPMRSFGMLNLVPRAGAGYVSYSDIEGGADVYNGDSESRAIAHLGLDASMKFSKTFPNAINTKLGVRELRHIFQPYMKYSYLTADDVQDGFPRVDRLTPSTKLRPVDVSRFSAVDDLQSWNIVRLGAFNRLQTKRNNGTYPWFNLNSYFDLYLEDPEFERDISNFFNEARWSPLPWLDLVLDSQIPLGDDFEFTEVNTYLNFQPSRNFQFNVGHFYLQDHPFFLDSSNMRLSTYTRINDNWGFGTVHYYEFEDSTLELQQYTLHRDLSSWTAAIGAQVRDNRVQDEFGLVFSLTLKAFPRISLPVDFVSNQTGPGF